MRDRLCGLSLSLSLSLLCSPARADVFYVRDYTPPGPVTGTSWATAFSSIEQALAEIPPDGSHVLRIAAAQPGRAWKPGAFNLQSQTGIGAWGTWPGASCASAPVRTATFEINGAPSGGLRIEGGFPPNPLVEPDRCVFSHHTVLSGDLCGDDPLLSGYSPIPAVPGGPSPGLLVDENTYHVLTIKNANELLVIDGLVVERGNADFGESTMPDGIAAGQGGGGVYLPPTGLPGSSSTFATPVLQNCTIQLNTGRFGAGLTAARYASSATEQPSGVLRLKACTIRANRATEDGGGIAVGFGHIELDGCLLVSNRAQGYGGAALIAAPYDSSGQFGPGGIAKAIFRQSTIADNQATTFVGGVGFDSLLSGSALEFRGSILCQNRVGCQYFEVLPDEGCEAVFDGGVQLGAVAGRAGEIVPQFVDTIRSTPVVLCPEGSGPNDPWRPNERNVEDPHFLNAGLSVPVLERDYRLHMCSPARDAGLVSGLPLDLTDVDGDGVLGEYLPDRQWADRVQSSGFAVSIARADAGAIEHAAMSCRLDLDFDGVVGSSDLAILLGAWNPSSNFGISCDDFPLPPSSSFCVMTFLQGDPLPQCACLDVNRDYFIEGPELAALLGAWGPCTGGQPEPPCGEFGGFAMEEQSNAQSGGGGATTTPDELAWLFGFGGLRASRASPPCPPRRSLSRSSLRPRNRASLTSVRACLPCRQTRMRWACSSRANSFASSARGQAGRRSSSWASKCPSRSWSA